MLKKEFVKKVSDKTGLTVRESEKAVNAVLDAIVENVCQGKRVSFVGFGTFYSMKRASSVGRNPRTGKTIPIAERTIPKFKFGKVFKQTVLETKKNELNKSNKSN